MDRLVLDPFSMPGIPTPRRIINAAVPPRVDIQDVGKAYEITAELPGIKKEDVDITIEGNLMFLKVDSKKVTEEKEKDYLLRERSSFSFQKIFEFPEEVLPNKSSGEMKDGILVVIVPKKKPVAEPKAHRVRVK